MFELEIIRPSLMILVDFIYLAYDKQIYLQEAAGESPYDTQGYLRSNCRGRLSQRQPTYT